MEVDCRLQPIIHSYSSRKLEEDNGGNFLVLSDDILIEILCRLLDKPLFRLKSVSKAWYHLISHFCIPIISSPPAVHPRAVVGLYYRTFELQQEKHLQFVTRTRGHPLLYRFSSDVLPKSCSRTRHFGHYASLNEEGAKVFEWDEGLSSYGLLPFMPEPDDLLDCCNGLLLFLDTNSRDYYVSNPFTKQSVLILRPDWGHDEFLNAALAFDPSRSTSFRVVRFQRSAHTRSLVLHIYTSYNRIDWSRRSIQQDACDSDYAWFRPSTYFNGALFRLSLSWHLIRINLEKFSVDVTELPLTFGESKGLIDCLGVMKCRLCYAYANEDGEMMKIWSFEDEGSRRWILMHNINIYDLTRDLVLCRECDPPNSKWVGPIAFGPSSNIVFLGSPLVILRYDLDNSMVEEVIRIEKDLILPGCYYPAFTYVRYLAPFDEEGNLSAMPM